MVDILDITVSGQFLNDFYITFRNYFAPVTDKKCITPAIDLNICPQQKQCCWCKRDVLGSKQTANEWSSLIKISLLRQITDVHFCLLAFWLTDASGAYMRREIGTSRFQVTAFGLTATEHYLDQCWLHINGIFWHLSQWILTGKPQDINNQVTYIPGICTFIARTPRAPSQYKHRRSMVKGFPC